MGHAKVKRKFENLLSKVKIWEKKKLNFFLQFLNSSLRTMGTFKSAWCSNNKVRELNLLVAPVAIYPYA